MFLTFSWPENNRLLMTIQKQKESAISDIIYHAAVRGNDGRRCMLGHVVNTGGD
jgi:hypothetical protein